MVKTKRIQDSNWAFLIWLRLWIWLGLRFLIVGDSNPIPLDDNFAVTRQLQGLVNAVNDLQNQIKGLNQAAADIVRGSTSGVITNFLRNADVNTSDNGRRGFTYTAPPEANNAIDVCSFFYGPDSASAGPFTDSTNTTESPEAIPAAVYGLEQGSITTGTPNLSSVGTLFDAGMVTQRCIVVGAGAAGANLDTIIDVFIDSQHVTLHDNAGTTVVNANVIIVAPGQGCAWNQSGGTLWVGGSQSLVSPLQKNYARPGVGNNIFILFSARLNPVLGGLPLTSDYQFRASIWDNTVSQQKIIEGAPITITATLDRGAGAVTRQYVVRYLNASGDSFLSSVSAAASVAGTPSPVDADPGQVSVVFPMYSTVQSVQVFRSDDETSLSDYVLIDTVSTGIDNIQDNGGRSGAIYNFTDDNWLADALVLNIGSKLTTSLLPVSMQILTPATYDLSATDPNSQWFRLDILDGTGAVVAIPPMALELDFFGLSYRPGSWILSSDDQQAEGDFESNSPNPAGNLPTGDPGTPGGGGEIGRGDGFFGL